MERRWYYRTETGATGPITSPELAGLFRSGVLTPESLLSVEGDPDWAPARERVPDLTQGPPPVREADLQVGPRRGWADTAPHPWRRYFARFMDNLVIGSALWMAFSTIAYLVDPEAADRAFSLLSHPAAGLVEAMLTLVLVLPAHALMVGLTGLSPGKWVFGVRVLRGGKPIGVPSALLRELGVWTRGLGLGVPILSLLTLATSYAHLNDRGAAPWDQARGAVVVHRRAGAFQILLMLIFVPTVIAAAVALRWAGAQ